LRKPQQNGRGDAAAGQVIDNLAEVGGARITLGGAHNQIAFAVYVEVARAPVLDSVGFYSLFYCGGQLSGFSLDALSTCINPHGNRGWMLSGRIADLMGLEP
jgi:hypothetical protein